MKSRTVTETIDVPPGRVYAFASDPENLPRWVPSFCRSVERVDGRWVVQSPLGPAEFAFAPPNAFGVLDHTVTLASGERFSNPMRVVANGDGSEVIFTLFRQAGVDDAQFEADAAHVQDDLRTLRRVLESGADAER